MSKSDDALADDAQSLLAAYRADEALPADVRARVWARVDRSVQARPAATIAAAAPSSARWAGLGLAVAAAIAAIWWGRALFTTAPSESSPSAAAFDRDDERSSDTATEATTARRREPAALPPALPPAAIPTPAAMPRDDAPTPGDDGPAPTDAETPTRPAPRTTPARASVEIDALADEMELLRAATSALARKDARHALALLDAGKRRFGTGTLTEEREALHVLALCELGRRSKARSEADAFAAAHPSSPLRARVRAACADDPP